MCQQQSGSTEKTGSPKLKASSKANSSAASSTVIPKETSTPEPQVMYINPLVESHTPDTAKVEPLKTINR